jgi:hypothetical protein
MGQNPENESRRISRHDLFGEVPSVFRFRPLLFAGAFALLASFAGKAQDLTVYDDALQNGFIPDYSYGGVAGDLNIASTAQAHGGTKSISFIGDGFNALSLAAPNSTFTAAQYPTLHFWVHGGTAGGQQLRLYLQIIVGGVSTARVNVPLGPYVSGGSIVASAWKEVTVPLGPLTSATFNRVDLQNDLGGAQPVLYIDDVTLQAPSGAPASTMLIEHDVAGPVLLSDRFTWNDSAGKPRVAVLAHNDTAPVNGSRGGALHEFRYQLPNNTTRAAGVTTYGNGGYGGFGYVVSHRGDGTTGLGGADDSPLGFAFAGSFQRIFEGRHHAIFRFTQMYPRHSSTTANPPNTTYMVPVTIDWMFSTGRDNPVWAVTWDLSGVPADALNDDSRAPYGELNIDGAGAADISGVGWGDRYKFFSTTAPVTLSSAWDWTQANTVPYVKLWIASTDATMGTVQTQTLAQQDAGAGRNPFWHDLRGNWGFTSAHGNAGEDVMPWQDSWPFQANSFSIGSGVSNNNARLTWGAMYGFLGQTSYATNNGLVANASGHPKVSYSTYVVLGTHSSAPVEAQVTQVETVQSLTLSTAIGSVVTSGPAGVARADNVTYAPAGYNHVYGALSFTAAGNQLDANVTVGAGTLKKPLVILGNYTAAVFPPTVKFAGATLVQDTDYFPSLRAGANELWITLNRDLTGATNHLEILSGGACVPPATPVIVAPASATPGQAGLTASVTDHAGSTFAWGIANGTFTPLVTSNQITFTAGAAGTVDLTVVETNAGCASAQAAASVPIVPVGGGVTVAVDPNADRLPVSPLIFGVNFGDAAQLARMHWPVRRWGGTPTSRYNWQIDVDNSGNDWFYLNNVKPLPPPGTNLPDGSTADVFIDETRAAGSHPFMTVPTLGWTPTDRSYGRFGFSISKYVLSQQWNECSFTGQVPPNCNPDMGNGFRPDGVTPIVGNDPLDTSVPVVGTSLVTGWKAHIATRTGTAGTGGVKFFGLDNEPMLWNYAHRDVHPGGTTYDEHWTKGSAVAAALKALDPAVQIIGPNEWGWCGWLDSAADYNAPGGSCFVLGPDAIAHGNTQFSAWWLAQAKAYELAHAGTRIVDYFSLHFYPQGTAIPLIDPNGNGDTPTTQALRLRSLKELYDRNWLSESWIGQNGGKIFLIPRMHDWIAANYPGTKLAIGEYNFGDVGVSSALAQAEALAIFGREGVDMALRWLAPSDPLIEDAFSMYMNYDGAGSKVAGDSIRAVSSNVDTVGSYALRDTSGLHPGRLYVLLFNKDVVPTTTAVTIAGAIQGNVSLWRLPNPARLAAAGTVAPAGATFTLPLPARSATLAVVDLAPCAPPATPAIAAPANATPGQTGLVASVVNDAGSTYAWSITNGAITAGNGTSQITFTAGAAGTLGLTVVETNGSGCDSAPATASVNVAAPPPGGLSLHPLPPCRLFDTRNATGPDAAAPALSGLGTRTFVIGGRCGLPPTAKSLSVNMTVVGATAPGSLLLYAADLGSAPVATSLSFSAGKIRSNNGYLLLAADGSGFKALNSSPVSVHFVLDVNGWFE